MLKKIIRVFVALALLSSALFLILHLFKLPPRVSFNSEKLMGSSGPLRLTFNQPMDRASVEERLHMEPFVDLRFSWNENTIWVWPNIAFPIGAYHLILESGAANQSGERIVEATAWSLSIREAQLVFLYPANEASELWKGDLHGGSLQQLTFTAGKVYDFAVSKDGERIVFSVVNAQQGADLWGMDRDGNHQEKLAGCGSDRCIEPALSPTGDQVAYTRILNDRSESGATSNIWRVEWVGKQTAPLTANSIMMGTRPLWAPVGNRLAFVDAEGGLIRVFDFNNPDKMMGWPSTGSEAATWSPDGKALLIPAEYMAGIQSFGGWSRVDLETGSMEFLFNQSANPADFSSPEYSPDGSWIVVGRRDRLLNGRSSTQLWGFDPQSSRIEPITSDQNYSHGSFSWSPDGERIVFQRYPLGSSDSTPEIRVWERTTLISTRVLENAALPQWLP